MSQKEPNYIDEKPGENLHVQLEELYRALLNRLLSEFEEPSKPVDPKIMKVAVTFLQYVGVRPKSREQMEVSQQLRRVQEFGEFPFK